MASEINYRRHANFYYLLCGVVEVYLTVALFHLDVLEKRSFYDVLSFFREERSEGVELEASNRDRERRPRL